MMFKFDFYQSAEGSAAPGDVAENATQGGSEDMNATSPAKRSSSYLARRIEPAYDVGAKLANGVEGQVALQSGDLTLVRVVPRSDACSGAPSDSDLVPGIYEGGLKVWEASIDLIAYLTSNLSLFCETGKRPEKEGRKHVLELGCGHGFPGIIAMRQGMHVCFSDYNSEVIEQVAMPNVRLNVRQEHWDLAEYFCGDWGSLSPLLDQREEGGRFDLILTAETLYTTTVAEKVLQMILRHLASTGQALVASKRFYFGTGGSTQHFRGLIDSNGRLECIDVHLVDTGKGNIREILKVSWRGGQGPVSEREGR